MQKTHQQEEARAPERTAAANLWGRVKLIVGLIALAVLTLFLLQNFQHADIRFLWFEWRTRMVFALLAAAVAGAIATIVIGALQVRGKGKQD
ncbi:MAG: hypothetical protein ACYDEB_01680 [Dehalococcoidia bacterium]